MGLMSAWRDSSQSFAKTMLCLLLVHVPRGIASGTRGTSGSMNVVGGRVEPTCANASDCTPELQAALDSCANAEVALSAGIWVTRPLSMRCDGQRLNLAPGAELQALRGDYMSVGAVMLTLRNVSGATIYGPGATLRMWRADYNDSSRYKHSEGRHAIALRGASNISIGGLLDQPLTVAESGGDGTYIAHDMDALPEVIDCRNISIQAVNYVRNYRQGISVIGVRGLRIRDTILSYTAGTPPQAGIDLEPDFSANELSDIYLSNVTARGNKGRGFQFSLMKVGSNTPPITAVFEDCAVEGTGMYGFSLSGSSDNGLRANGGNISVRRLRVSDTGSAGILVEGKPGGLALEFVDAQVNNTAGPAPLWMEGQTVPTSNVWLRNVSVYDATDRPVIKLKGTVNGLRGDVEEANPTKCTKVDLGKGNEALHITCRQKMLKPAVATVVTPAAAWNESMEVCSGKCKSDCKLYRPPVDACYSPPLLWPADVQWGRFDTLDRCNGTHLDRSFFSSVNGSCTHRTGGFSLPLDTCIGPFGKPRPWGKFSCSRIV